MPHKDIEKSRAYKAQWRQENQEKCAEKDRRWQRANPEKCAVKNRRWKQANLEKNAEINRRWRKIKYASDPRFRLLLICRTRIQHALHGRSRAQKTIDLLGCTIDQLRSWLAQKFQAGMSWDNYGVWHIDHILPCASFDLTDPKQQQQCFHYTNLQPLWAKDNLKKGAKHAVRR